MINGAEADAAVKEQVVHRHRAGEMVGEVLYGQRREQHEQEAIGDDQNETASPGEPRQCGSVQRKCRSRQTGGRIHPHVHPAELANPVPERDRSQDP